MANDYILDLEKEEYRDNFVTKDNRTFWQFEARDSLIEKLTTTLRDAKSYKIERQENKNKTWLSHNAILVSGQRGAGKTVFLRNCADIWKSEQSNGGKHKADELYFLKEIDPTMLINEDNFSNVVIAQIYSEVERKLQAENCCDNSNASLDKHKSTFHKALKRLADSLGKQDDFNGLTGIDKIQQYKSGIHIERYFHEFIEAAIDILGCSALVLPIDDVDMALDRAFEVVDDVRRLLGCPYIIPIVSGDYRLYEQMTNVHFDQKSYRDESGNTELQVEGRELAKKLTNAYLTKVFPNQMRITLLPIMYITPTLIIEQINYDGKATNYKYKDYKNDLLQQFYPLCHNKEVLESWPEPESARELTQLIRTMSPRRFIDALNDNESKANYKLWKSYINWAEQKQNGVAFTNANSYLNLVNREPSELFDIQELANFNPKQQMIKELYPWAQKDFYSSQLAALGFTNTASDDKLSQASKDNRTILDSAFNKNSFTLRSMPPLEFIDTKSFVTIDTIVTSIYDAQDVKISTFLSDKNIKNEDDIEFTIEEVLIDLYMHGDVYSKLQNTYQYVFMSRVFEVIFYSFISEVSSEIQEKDLFHILQKTPFYSVFNMAPTKSILSEEDSLTLSKSSQTKENIRNKLGLTNPTTSKVLGQLIQEWRLQHSDFFSNFDSKTLVSIFGYMFNKTFTSFNEFKKEVFSKDSFVNEHLTDFAKRFEYMLINSAYTAVIQGVAVQANVAFTDNHNTIRSINAFNRSERVLTRNKDRFNKEENNLHEAARLFIEALENHPVFKLIQQNDQENGVIIPEKIKMGKDNYILTKLRKNAITFLSTDIIFKSSTVKTIIGFNNKIKDNEAVADFYQSNESDLRRVHISSSEKEQNNRVINFIIALKDTFKSN